MSKRSWNDINDEDSSLSSHEEQIEQPPKIVKAVSSPAPASSRLKRACDEMSMLKIEKHEKRDVWLYIPNSFYDKADQVGEILQSYQKLKTILTLKPIGWNVLVEKHVGYTLIQDGYQKNDIFIKFIYSNKNEQVAKRPKKITYVQKIIKPIYQQKQQEETIQSVQLSHINNQEKTNEDIKEQKQKKKPKWIEKQKSLNIQVAKTINQEVRSPKKYIQVQKIKSPKKYQQKQAVKVQKQQLVIESKSQSKVKQQDQDQLFEQNQQKIKSESRYMKKEEKQAEDHSAEVSDDSSLEKEKKKKKKNKKKNKGAKNDKIDNNPYSSLVK